MRFNLKVKEFLGVLNTAQSIVTQFGNTGTNFGIAVGNSSKLIVENGGAILVMDLGQCVTLMSDDKFAFAFDLGVLTTLLERRAQAELEYIKPNLKFYSKTKSSVYNGEVLTKPFTDSLMAAAKESKKPPKGVGLTDEAFAVMETGIKHCTITSLYRPEDLFAILKSKHGTITVSMSDDLHMSLFSGRKLKGVDDFSVALPARYFANFQRIRELYPKAECRLKVDTKSVCLYSEDFYLKFPSVQVDNKIYDRVESLFGRLGDSALAFDIEQDRLNTSINNFTSIYEQGALVEIGEPRSKGEARLVTFNFKTSYGKMSESVRVENMKEKKFTPVKVDPSIFLDSLKALDGVVNVSIIEKPRAFAFRVNLGDNNSVRHLGLLADERT